MAGKSKEDLAERKEELEKRLQDVTGQLGASKKQSKKGTAFPFLFLFLLSKQFRIFQYSSTSLSSKHV